MVDWMSRAYILYTFDLGPCDYIAYLKKKRKGEKRKGGREKEKGKEEKRREEGRKREGEREGGKEKRGRRKKGKKEEKEGKMEGGKHPSCSFALAFSPRRYAAASDTMAPEVAAPHGPRCPLLILFGLHLRDCSSLGFFGPRVRQDLPFHLPCYSRD